MPGPRGVITVNGNTERSLHTEKHTAAVAVEAQSSLLRQSTSSATKDPDTFKCAWSNWQQDFLARSELALQCGPHPGPSQTVKSAPRVHNYALKIPWAQTGRGARRWDAPSRGLNHTRGFPLCYFSLSRLQSLETLSDSVIAEHMMHHPRRHKATSHHGTPRWITITSEIFVLILFLSLPLEGTCQTVLLSAYRTTCIILL